MKSVRNAIIVNTLAALMLLAYIIAAAILYADKTEQNNCRKLDIIITDSLNAQFVTPEIVTQWLDSMNLNPVGRNMHNLPLNKIERLMKLKTYIASVKTYASMDGVCVIKITQKIPLLRINSNQGYDFYIDLQHNILPPTQHYFANVPIVTGNLNFTFQTNYYGPLNEKNTKKDKVFLENLINFVNFIAKDDFLCPLVTQIWIGEGRNIELIPRIGSQKIILGNINNYPQKLLKLKKFYIQSFKNGWWQTASTVNVEYQNQIILK